MGLWPPVKSQPDKTGAGPEGNLRPYRFPAKILNGVALGKTVADRLNDETLVNSNAVLSRRGRSGRQMPD